MRYLLSALLGDLVVVPLAAAGSLGRLILVDGSVIARPGSPGTEWRIQLSWEPFGQQPRGMLLTDFVNATPPGLFALAWRVVWR